MAGYDPQKYAQAAQVLADAGITNAQVPLNGSTLNAPGARKAMVQALNIVAPELGVSINTNKGYQEVTVAHNGPERDRVRGGMSAVERRQEGLQGALDKILERNQGVSDERVEQSKITKTTQLKDAQGNPSLDLRNNEDRRYAKAVVDNIRGNCPNITVDLKKDGTLKFTGTPNDLSKAKPTIMQAFKDNASLQPAGPEQTASLALVNAAGEPLETNNRQDFQFAKAVVSDLQNKFGKENIQVIREDGQYIVNVPADLERDVFNAIDESAQSIANKMQRVADNIPQPVANKPVQVSVGQNQTFAQLVKSTVDGITQDPSMANIKGGVMTIASEAAEKVKSGLSNFAQRMQGRLSGMAQAFNQAMEVVDQAVGSLVSAEVSGQASAIAAAAGQGQSNGRSGR